MYVCRNLVVVAKWVFLDLVDVKWVLVSLAYVKWVLLGWDGNYRRPYKTSVLVGFWLNRGMGFVEKYLDLLSCLC